MPESNNRPMIWAILFASSWVPVSGCKSRSADAETKESPGQTTATVTVGGIMPLSGPVSTVGQAWTRGWELYWDKVNSEGGIPLAGKKVRVNFVAADSKFDAESASQSAKKLIYKDGATFVFGELTNAAASAIQAVAAKEHVLSVVPWLSVPGGDGDVSASRPGVVRPFVSPNDSWQMDYDYLRQEWPAVKKVAVAGWLGNETMLERAAQAAQKNGYQVVAKDTYALNSQDFVPFFTKLLASKPDAIQLNSSPISGFLVRAVRQLGFKGPVFSDSPLDPLVIKETAGADNADNVFCNGMDPASPTAEMSQVVDRWNKKYGDKFVSDAWLAWDTASVVEQAIVKAGTVEPSKVVAAFEQMTHPGDVKTSFGDGFITGKDAFGVDRVLAKPIPISRIDHGAIKLVKLTLPAASPGATRHADPAR